MKKSNILYGLMLGIAVLLLSCDSIDKDERLIYVPPVSANRAVLIEDFTGQRCVNCPTATEEIAKLQEQYGEENVIAVGIHSGPFAHRTTMTSPLLPLGTTTGDEYYTHWGITAQPAVLINRTGSPLYASQQYGAAVREALEQQSPVTMQLTIDALTKPTITMTVETLSNEDINDAKLQVWVLEDSIVGAQYMPDGTVNREYIHNHVFRASVTNQLMGDSFPVSKEQATTASYTITLDETWNANNLSIVAFVYNDRLGVIQVIRRLIP